MKELCLLEFPENCIYELLTHRNSYFTVLFPNNTKLTNLYLNKIVLLNYPETIWKVEFKSRTLGILIEINRNTCYKYPSIAINNEATNWFINDLKLIIED